TSNSVNGMALALWSGLSLMTATSRLRAWARVAMPVVVAAVLLCLAVANVGLRRSFAGEVEDGVLWAVEGGDVVARAVADDGPAARAGLQVGDRLLLVDGKPVASPSEVIDRLHALEEGDRLRYTVLRID